MNIHEQVAETGYYTPTVKPRRTLTKVIGQRQIDKVADFVAGKLDVTLAQISAATGASEAAASARLRELRSKGYEVVARKSQTVKGLHYYTVYSPAAQQANVA